MFLEKYIRRFHRLIDIIKGNKPIYFIRMGDINIYEKEELENQKKRKRVTKKKRSWRCMKLHDVEQWLQCLNKQFLKSFVAWQKENQAIFLASEKMKDLEVMYMMKMNAQKKFTTEFKKWLVQKTKT